MVKTKINLRVPEWTRHVVRMGAAINTCRISIGNTNGNTTLRRRGPRGQAKFTMYLKRWTLNASG